MLYLLDYIPTYMSAIKLYCGGKKKILLCYKWQFWKHKWLRSLGLNRTFWHFRGVNYLWKLEDNQVSEGEWWKRREKTVKSLEEGGQGVLHKELLSSDSLRWYSNRGERNQRWDDRYSWDRWGAKLEMIKVTPQLQYKLQWDVKKDIVIIYQCYHNWTFFKWNSFYFFVWDET